MTSKRAFLFSALMLGCTLTPVQAQSDLSRELPPSFTVTDERAPEEISEVSRLYLDGNLVATFRLGLSKAHETQTIALPVGRSDVDYALCGEITIVRNGHQETHQVSSEGQLHHPEGHSLDAVGSNNFTDFFLVDYDDAAVATHRHGRAAVCATPNT